MPKTEPSPRPAPQKAALPSEKAQSKKGQSQKVQGEKMRGAGIREVAKQAGVSIATVSRALSDEGVVSPQTRQRVVEWAAALDYKPSPLGRNLVRGRSDLIGLIVPNVAFPLYGEMIRAIGDVLGRHGMSILLASSHDDEAAERGAAQHLLKHALDGGIVINSRLGPLLPLQRHSGWVHVAPEVSGLPHRVELDNEAGGALAAHELLASQRRRLAYVGAEGRESAERERGFARVVAGAGLTYRRFGGDYSEVSGLRAGEALLDGAVGGGSGWTSSAEGVPGDMFPDGIFAAGDLMAAGVLRSLHRRGLRVPQQVAVIGFDDAVIASLLYPRLTSIRQPAYPMGVAAANLALRLLEGQSSGPLTFLPELVRRESTGPPE
ncbi:LacI family transcriptional regulator (plasmid) [Deinococcus psychrotolerans]|uniref:LacI family transcriptional regulator n=1 Tax=Deinococcus psychrotolerans TaxID=2489213 RepID=A0A3G8YIB7_9DEIO|nr:LacI family DNA-binding transcriptional regulator [Deinococcus psychrotolerans]AZI44723.1 LacI family transcriptional regulator [Deinococcus psychrotolerans]